MKNIEVLGFAVKVLAVFVFVKGLSGAAAYYVYVLDGGYAPEGAPKTLQYVTLISQCLLMIAAILMWRFPISIAKWFLPRSNDEGFPKVDSNLSNLEIVGFSILGVYILSWAIPDLIHNIGYFSIVGDGTMYDQITVWELKLNTFVTVVEIGIGVVLCAFSGNVRNLLISLRK